MALPLEGNRNMKISAMFSTHPGSLGDATETGRPREDPLQEETPSRRSIEPPYI